MFRNLRISTKLLIIIPPLVFLAAGVSAYLTDRALEEEMLRQALRTAQTYGDLIRESLVNMMVTNERIDDDFLARLNTIPDIRSLHIHFTLDSLRLREVFQDSTRLARLRRREALQPKLDNDEAAVVRSGNPAWKRMSNIFNAVIPFQATAKCQQCHRVPVGTVLGAADINISLDRMAATVTSSRIRSIWTLYISTSIAIIISAFFYQTLVARRLRELLAATEKIGSGNLDEPVAFTPARDEIGTLAAAFDRMRAQLRAAQERVLNSERLSLIGQMASSIIHDFRTPMSTINLAVQSLQHGKEVTPDKSAQWYSMIRDSVGRMIVMAQELLDFSRGETKIVRVSVPMHDFVRLLAESVRVNLRHHHVALAVEERCEGSAWFDPDRMHRALVNIITNAQDAMPHGGTLRLTTERTNGVVTFGIADTGTGIPEEIRAKIFDAFFTMGKKKGTGLGLAITKRIVDEHGGRIDIRSELGRGTMFLVTIPAGETGPG